MPAGGLTPLVRRAWNLPVGWHVAALAALLVALVPVVGTSTSFMSDEGAAIIQARRLSEGRGWIEPHPFPTVDPDGVAYPLASATPGAKGFAPFAKHPVYSVLLAGADRVGGVTAMVLLSVLGTVVAAALAGRLARRLRPGLVRPTVWTVGVGSPLLFDGYLVLAHTLAAALAVAAVLAAWRAIEGRPAAALGTGACVLGATLLRSEGVVFGMALSGASAWAAVAWRSPAPLVPGAAALAGGFLARAAEAGMIRAIVGRGGTQAEVSGGGASDLLDTRLNGVLTSLFKPSYRELPAGDLLLVLAAAVVLAGVLVARRRPEETGLLAKLGLVAVAALAARLVVDPLDPVPGLFLAFPVGWAGLWVLSRRAIAPRPAQLVVCTGVVFAAGVGATIYFQGGGAEWGGRYFALILPVVVPVVLAGLGLAGDRLDAVAARRGAAALAACSLLMAAMAVAVLRSSHRDNARLIAAVDRADPDRAGVMLTSENFAAQLVWPREDDRRWLYLPPSEMRGLARRLRAAGVERATLLSRHPDRDRRLLAGTYRVAGATRHTGFLTWDILALEAAGTGSATR